MNDTLRFLAIIFALCGILGCGGSGGGSKSTGAQLTREQIKQLIQDGIAQSEGIRDGGPGGTTSRSPKKARGALTRHPEDVYYDDYYALWVHPRPYSDEEFGWDYFEDEAMTKPAGYYFERWTSDGFAETFEFEETYLAGNLAGLWNRSLSHWNEDGSGTETGSGNYPGEGNYTVEGSWEPNDGTGGYLVGTWTQRWNDVDGFWNQYTVDYHEDGGLKLTMECSLGVTTVLNFSPDGSGAGTITGNGNGLPATITWDETGTGEITWSDGTKSPFDAWSFGI